MANGDIVVSEIVDARISCITREGKVVWSKIAPHVRYPSDAFSTEDGKQVIVVDRKTKDILWQYGQVAVKGHTPGRLNDPDGVDIDVFRDWKASASPR